MRACAKMSGFVVILWLTGCLRMHKDADGVGAVFRAWHPGTWLLLVVMAVPCALWDEKLFDVAPLRLSKFWRDNIDQLQRVTPFSDWSALRPFDYGGASRKEAGAAQTGMTRALGA